MDLKKRYAEHNQGQEKSTKRYLPWELIYYEAFVLEKYARNREMKLKYNGNAMKELKKRIGLGLPSTSLARQEINKVDSDHSPIRHKKRVRLSAGAGFTLVELLVVIGIIGVLAGAFVVMIDPITQSKKARDSQRKSDLRQIQTGLELFRSDQGRYPTTSELGASLSSGGVTYMKTVPKDPSSGNSYIYSPSGGSYTISSCAEYDKDKEAVSGSISGCSTTKKFEYSSP